MSKVPRKNSRLKISCISNSEHSSEFFHRNYCWQLKSYALSPAQHISVSYHSFKWNQLPHFFIVFSPSCWHKMEDYIHQRMEIISMKLFEEFPLIIIWSPRLWRNSFLFFFDIAAHHCRLIFPELIGIV